MKALAISGSPRREGNTELLLRRCCDGLSRQGIETQCLSLSGLSIRGCIACNRCRAPGAPLDCAVEDDFQQLFPAMREADILIVGSPVYFGSATPETKALLGRAGYIGRPHNLFSRKIGGPVAVARRAGENFTYAQLLYWFTINDMVVPGSSYWNIGHGKNKGDVLQDAEALQTMDRFAENLAWLGKNLRGN